MLIDTLSIKYSDKLANSFLPGKAKDFISQFKAMLLLVGWTVTEGLFATVTIRFPLGVPTADSVPIFPKRQITCPSYPGFVTVGDQPFALFDPNTEVPPALGPCAWVEMDTGELGTLTNIAHAIAESTAFNAHGGYVDGYLQLTLTAQDAGGDANLIDIQGAGGYIEGGAITTGGGGWKMKSRGGSFSAQYELSFTAQPGFGVFGNLVFDFLLDGGPVQYRLLDLLGAAFAGAGGVPGYTVIANGYGFCIMERPHDSGGRFRTISLFAMAPYFPKADEVPPTEVFVPANAVMIVGPNAIGGVPAWSDNSAACLDSSPFTNYGSNPFPRSLALQSPGPPLLSPAGAPVILGAYAMFGQERTEGAPAWVVGKLWDCAIVSDVITEASSIDSKHFLTLGYSEGENNYPCCTFMMCAGKEIVPDPVKPPDPLPPAPRSGTVNLFGDGASWVTGDKFKTTDVGLGITIAGYAYVIKTVDNDETIWLTEARVIVPNAPFTMP